MSNVDIKEFARDVERLCDFLLDKADKDGSEDIKVVQKLKETSADIQFLKESNVTLSGLSEYMKGAPT